MTYMDLPIWEAAQLYSKIFVELYIILYLDIWFLIYGDYLYLKLFI